MTAHLLLFTIGPVQDFIKQARRTRDLWHGSHLLSELSRAAARKLVDCDAMLVFPALARGDSELSACLSPLRQPGELSKPSRGNPGAAAADTSSNDAPPLNVANRLLAELPAHQDPGVVARAVREAVQRFWRDEIAAPVRDACAGLLAPDTDAAWREQIDSLLEFAAAWVPLGDYARARRELDRTIAARKELRDFAPWRQLRPGARKSSLDGARETVLLPCQQRDARQARRYRIVDAEELDAVGLVKRAGGGREITGEDVDDHVIQFPPVVNVALASWTTAAARHAPASFNALVEACRKRRIPRILRGIPCARAFRFDATVFLRSRWASVFKERGLGTGDEANAWGRSHVAPVLAAMSEPFPYVACLVADGDRMGQAIEELDTAELHRRFSRELSEFATRARSIVEQHHLGSLVYAGGDDVVAFVPLPEALGCASALRRAFTEVMAQACPRLDERELPTLSVGLGVGHVMESMSELLQLGRDAETLAKGNTLPAGDRRNALAVIVDRRSGGRRAWRARWSGDHAVAAQPSGGDPVARLMRDAALLNGAALDSDDPASFNAVPCSVSRASPEGVLSSGKIYEIEQTLKRMPPPRTLARAAPDTGSVDTESGSSSAHPTTDDLAWTNVLAREVQRVLARTRGGGPRIDPATVGLSLDTISYAALHETVSRWVNRLLIARVFAAAAPRPARTPVQGAA